MDEIIQLKNMDELRTYLDTLPKDQMILATNKFEENPFMMALKHYNFKAMRLFVKMDPLVVNRRYSFIKNGRVRYNTPIRIILGVASISRLKFLLKNGAECTISDCAPLLCVEGAPDEKRIQILNYLFKINIWNLTFMDHQNKNILFLFCSHYTSPVLTKYLLDYARLNMTFDEFSAFINAKDNSGVTPIKKACGLFRVTIIDKPYKAKKIADNIKLLIDYGVDLSLFTAAQLDYLNHSIFNLIRDKSA